MSAMFHRAECETCGGPLTRSGRGRYVCQYCGSVYYTDGTQEAHEDPAPEPEPVIPDPEFVVEPLVPDPVQPADDHRSSWAMPLVLMGAMGVAVFFVLLVVPALFGVFQTGSSFDTARETLGVATPEMLPALPASAYAGKVIAYDGWEIEADPALSTSDGAIGLRLSVRNWDSSQAELRFVPGGLQLFDDVGNSYPLAMGNCAPDQASLERQLVFAPFQDQTLQSDSFWCRRADELPFFSGVIPGHASRLYLRMERFGVFDGLTFVWDL